MPFEIIVFGSRARGHAERDSDLDVIVLVERRSPGMEQCLDEAAYKVMWKHNFRPIISLRVMGKRRFTRRARANYPFYRNVLREGVAI